MTVTIISRKTRKLFTKYLLIYPSRRAAFRAAKRDGRIPVAQQPDEVIMPDTPEGEEMGLDERNVRLYVFNIIVGAVAFEYHIREDKEAFYGTENTEGDQLPHFNSGESGRKLKGHHYWLKRNKNENDDND